MSVPDYAKAIKNAVAADWAVSHETWTATLEVDDDYQPTPGNPTLLVADDTGPAMFGGAWMAKVSPRRPVLRLTAFAAGRSEAIDVVTAGAQFVVTHKPGVSRVEDFPAPLVTRDRETGAYLASITMPVIVRTL
ncbi:hypothetical protein [Mycolicibacterium sp. XJ1819]